MVWARCRATPHADVVFFPDRHHADYSIARKICGECPVKQECLAFAIYHREHYGMWGGLTPMQRRGLPIDKRRKLRQWWVLKYGRR